ncbi:hypothetical protein ADUPG1_008669 [Aduncisulcus paluster]|uniref:Phosphatidic acid phosphatase type 2/haloperoxidase domain-containing protein n=1 Tax=Aduncisulcus paluster TaxID=2918883 RepID=A0ABQ5KSS6_9EUKA|nr:hypothetical protein ADUPG1_008669 [Aduncisulcus paluster]
MSPPKSFKRSYVKKYCYILSEKFDNFFRRIDDYITSSFQKPLINSIEEISTTSESHICHSSSHVSKNQSKTHKKPLYYVLYGIAQLFTLVTAIELGVAIPIVLFAVGLDDEAGIMMWLVLWTALISQLPKRFIWRDRPYMQGRATRFRKDETSSFPSRAVTCSLVYTIGLGACLSERFTQPTPWWIWIIVVVSILATSWARIILGVHFFSDCIFGVLQGLIVVGLGFLTDSLLVFNCGACSVTSGGSCYSETSDLFLPQSSFNILILSVSTIVALVLCYLCLCRPLRFWIKAQHVLGMLLPSLAFRLTALCKTSFLRPTLPPPFSVSSGSEGESLATPIDWIAGIGISIVMSLVGLLLRPKDKSWSGKRTKKGESKDQGLPLSLGRAWISFGVFCGMYACVFAFLYCWRANREFQTPSMLPVPDIL